jgi:hypothetical protein
MRNRFENKVAILTSAGFGLGWYGSFLLSLFERGGDGQFLRFGKPLS